MSEVNDQQPKPPEFERIPVSLSGLTMIQKVKDWYNFFMQLTIESVARTDEVNLRDGWQLDMSTGHWRRTKREEVKDATVGTKESA